MFAGLVSFSHSFVFLVVWRYIYSYRVVIFWLSTFSYRVYASGLDDH